MTRLLLILLTSLTAASLTAGQHCRIHTSALLVQAGDRIGLNLQVADTDSLPADSLEPDLYAYAELYDSRGLLLQRARLIRRDTLYPGYLFVPTDTRAGVHYIRAYTRFMAEHGDSLAIRCVYIVPLGKPMPALTAADSALLRTPRLQPIRADHPEWAQHETFSVLGGTVLSGLRHKPAPGISVNLIIPEYHLYAVATTDEQGTFLFRDLELPEGTRCLLTATRADVSGNGLRIRVDEPAYPPFSTAELTDAEALSSGVRQLEYTDFSRAIDLQQVDITARRYDRSQREQEVRQLADISFGEKQIHEYQATCLHELLRRVPGVVVFQDKCYIRASTSIFGDNPAAIAVNGVIQEDNFDLDILHMEDIARVDIFKTGRTAIWGPRGGSGVVSIIMKEGSHIPDARHDPQNMKRITLTGYQQ